MAYQEDRYTRIAEHNHLLANKSIKEVMSVYQKASKNISDEISKVYAEWGEIVETPIFDEKGILKGYKNKLALTQPEVSKRIIKDGRKITRLNAIKEQLNEYVQETTQQEKLITTNHLKAVAENTYYETMRETFNQVNVGKSFSLLSDSVLTAIIKNPVSGADFIERIGINNQALAIQVNQTLTNGIIQGLSINDMKNQLTSKIDIGKKNAERIIRTETTNTMAQASLESYKASGVVDQIIYIATLDEKTSNVCTDLDGEIIPLKKVVTGVNYPPMHPNCRSTTGAYFESMAGVGKRMSRTAEGGNKLVPVDMNKKRWDYFERAIKNEPQITASMEQITKEVGTKLKGLEYRLKEDMSYVEKIKTTIIEKGITDKEAISKINDVVRYTSISEPNMLAFETKQIMEKLNQNGYKIVRVRNTWEDKINPYKGINTVVQNEKGFKFELQFHTKESFDLKQDILHPLYEKERLPDTTPEEKLKLVKEMWFHSSKLKSPKDITSIENFDDI